MKELIRIQTLAFLVALAGCAAAPAREVQSPRDAVTELRAAFAMMSDDESAAAVRPELERARTWLAEADTAIGKDADPEKVALLVELSRGQLVLVKAILERKKAEAALAQKSEEYRKGREALRSIQERTKAAGEAPGEEP